MKTHYCDTVVTYFVPVPDLYDPSTQWDLIEVWRRSWAKAGWTPVVLTENDVKSYARFKFFDDIFSARPTEYGQPYTKSCFMRYVAAYHYGSLRGIPIFLSDYDVLAYDFHPRDLYPNEMTLFCEEPPAPVFMGSLMGKPQNFLDMAELFAAAKPTKEDWHARLGIYHQDDLSLMRRMFHDGNLQKPEWLQRRFGCRVWGRPNWETAPLVHYAYGVIQAGYSPKSAWVEKLRPF